MKKSKIKEVVICLISLAILTFVVMNGMGSKVLAANTSSELDNLINSRSNTIANDIGEDDDDDEENVVANTNKNTNKNVNLNNNTANKNVNNNTNTGIPYTGLDNSVTFVIIAFGISAVFAYKKIRDYKNI